MKYIIITISLLFASNVFCQSRQGNFEIYTEVVGGIKGTNSAKFEFYAQSPVWEITDDSIKPLISSLDYAHAAHKDCPHDCDLVYVPTEESSNYNYGIYHTESYNTAGNYPPNATFGNGKYKVKMTENTYPYRTFYFYIDYTTDNYTMGSNNDIWIEYTIYGSTKVRWSNSPTYTSVVQGSTYNIWSEKDFTRSTSKLELYLTLSEQSTHPYLSWVQYHDSNIYGYYLYRNLKPQGGMPVTTKIALSSSTTSYTDRGILTNGDDDDRISYYVRARLTSSTESLPGNIVNMWGEYSPYKINTENEVEEELIKYNLSPNYPNPFNPTTNITYQLPQKGQVVLKIYNVLGKKVAELINEEKDKGTYSVTFNAENLPSGMYFYKIQSGTFTDVKKMLLLK